MEQLDTFTVDLVQLEAQHPPCSQATPSIFPSSQQPERPQSQTAGICTPVLSLIDGRSWASY